MAENSSELRLAVPSDGPLYEPALEFLRACGLKVSVVSRRYTAEMQALPGVTVWFQRNADIPQRVDEGNVDMGVVGRDRYVESRRGEGNTSLVVDNLGFGHSELVIGVPDFWIDVNSLADLAGVSIDFREEGRDLRIATKYPRLVEPVLSSNGINYFSLVRSSGTLEAAPALDLADVIADISDTGTTMRENGLKPIHGGSIQDSQACLISNKRILESDRAKRSLAEALVERVEAYLESQKFYSVTANIEARSEEEVMKRARAHADIWGLKGPMIAKVYTREGEGCYAYTIIVHAPKLLAAVEQLRTIGGSSVTVHRPSYVFRSGSSARSRLT